MKSAVTKNVSLILFVISAAAALAQPRPDFASSAKLSLDDIFQPGQMEATIGGGPLFSPVGSPHHRPVINYGVGSFQLGWMLTRPSGDSFLRGNLQLVP